MRRAQGSPADPAVVASVGLAVGEHRHRPAAQPVLKAHRVLRLAASEASTDFLDLSGHELRTLGGPWRRLQLANGVKQRDELVNLKEVRSGLGTRTRRRLERAGLSSRSSSGLGMPALLSSSTA